MAREERSVLHGKRTDCRTAKGLRAKVLGDRGAEGNEKVLEDDDIEKPSRAAIDYSNSHMGQNTKESLKRTYHFTKTGATGDDKM